MYNIDKKKDVFKKKICKTNFSIEKIILKF
jgi:hypothetical protein